MTGRTPPHILPTIVGAQFAGGSLWFAGNAVLPQLRAELGIDGDVASVTAAVQIGFILGTAFLAASGLADRFTGRAVFFVSVVVGAVANVAVLLAEDLWTLVALRFVVGVALAGIYPVGMKIAAGWYEAGLGRALGFLVGALVLGTAFPHLVGSALPWRWTLVAVSALAFVGGALLFAFVPDGPHVRASTFDLGAIPKLLRIPRFRGAALGYFGHMWELYTFWAFLPALLIRYGDLPVAEISFAVIASGVVGCVGGGLLVERLSGRRVAQVQLAASGVCCLLLAFAIELPPAAFVAFLFVWGVTVVGDSPQYSAITARAAPPQLIGTGLAFVTSVGFALTVASIAIVQRADDLVFALTALAIGPVLGLVGLARAR
ncbi:MAG: MFS transporter [Deltaproteobacteria bacterium]|jgi:predicted MFS family arabinose efflux permease